MTTYEYKLVSKSMNETRMNTFYEHDLTEVNQWAAEGWRLFKDCKDCYILEKETLDISESPI